MKIMALFLSVAVLSAQAESSKKFTEFKRRPDSNDKCEQKVRALIIKTAQVIGQKQEFGFELQKEREGVDLMDRPLYVYSASVFIVPEGYISNSAARVIVRNPDTACEIVKFAISLGG